MIGEHLDDAAVLALLAGELDPPARAHVDGCARCRQALAAFGAVRSTLQGDDATPSPFASARMKRRLAAALDDDARSSRAAPRRARVAIIAAFAALSGAAFAMSAPRLFAPERLEMHTASSRSAAPARVSRERAPLVALDAPKATAPAVIAPPPAAPPPRVKPSRKAKGATRRLAVAPGTPAPAEAAERAWQDALAGGAGADWLELGDAFAAAGLPERAAEAFARGLTGPAGDEAGARLTQLVREDAVSPAAALHLLALAGEGAEPMRLRCEWGLRLNGDRQAVSDCQAFGRAFPAHPAVRSLAVAAGQVAETRLDDLELAVAEYSRALVVSQYAGIMSSEALLARARALAKQGDHLEAQADLRLYLHVAPEAWNRSEIRELAADLGVPRP